VLSILLLAAAMTTVPQMARAASRASDLDPHTVQLALSIAVAAGVVPARRVLDPLVERMLFHERYALRAGVDDLLRDLAAAGGPEALLTLVGERLEALVRPHACVIYAPLGDRFVPVFAPGVAAGRPAPALPADAAVIALLRAHPAPLD